MQLMVKVELEEAQHHELMYARLEACLHDEGLKALFDGGHVVGCSVHFDDQRITALPVMTWDRFKDHLISNSTAILRKLDTL